MLCLVASRQFLITKIVFLRPLGLIVPKLQLFSEIKPFLKKLNHIHSIEKLIQLSGKMQQKSPQQAYQLLYKSHHLRTSLRKHEKQVQQWVETITAQLSSLSDQLFSKVCDLATRNKISFTKDVLSMEIARRAERDLMPEYRVTLLRSIVFSKMALSSTHMQLLLVLSASQLDSLRPRYLVQLIECLNCASLSQLKPLHFTSIVERINAKAFKLTLHDFLIYLRALKQGDGQFTQKYSTCLQRELDSRFTLLKDRLQEESSIIQTNQNNQSNQLNQREQIGGIEGGQNTQQSNLGRNSAHQNFNVVDQPTRRYSSVLLEMCTLVQCLKELFQANNSGRWIHRTPKSLTKRNRETIQVVDEFQLKSDKKRRQNNNSSDGVKPNQLQQDKNLSAESTDTQLLRVQQQPQLVLPNYLSQLFSLILAPIRPTLPPPKLNILLSCLLSFPTLLSSDFYSRIQSDFMKQLKVANQSDVQVYISNRNSLSKMIVSMRGMNNKVRQYLGWGWYYLLTNNPKYTIQ